MAGQAERYQGRSRLVAEGVAADPVVDVAQEKEGVNGWGWHRVGQIQGPG